MFNIYVYCMREKNTTFKANQPVVNTGRRKAADISSPRDKSVAFMVSEEEKEDIGAVSLATGLTRSALMAKVVNGFVTVVKDEAGDGSDEPEFAHFISECRLRYAMPLTSRAQIEHKDAYEDFLTRAKSKEFDYAVLAYDPSVEEYELSATDSERSMFYDINCFVMFRRPIVAVVREGKILECEEIENLKQKQLDGMGVLASASALGLVSEDQ